MAFFVFFIVFIFSFVILNFFRKVKETDKDYELGLKYYEGNGVPEDKKKAFKLFKKAAELGYPEAQNFLGHMYSKGEGVQEDNEKAIEWFEKSAKLGYPEPQNNLGGMYVTGDCGIKDNKRALKWFKKAAEQGHSEAKRMLRVMK